MDATSFAICTVRGIIAMPDICLVLPAELAIPAQFAWGLIVKTQIAGFIDCVQEPLVIVEAAMKTEAPEAIGAGVGFVWFLRVFLVVSLHGINHADANLGNQVINGIQSVAVGFLRFQR